MQLKAESVCSVFFIVIMLAVFSVPVYAADSIRVEQPEKQPAPDFFYSDDELEALKEAERVALIKTCLSCHSMDKATLDKQPRRPRKKHMKAIKTNRSCTDCHASSEVGCCHEHIFPDKSEEEY